MVAQSLKPSVAKGLASGSSIQMVSKGSMTTERFIEYLKHFAKYMPQPHILSILDNAAYYFDFIIADETESLTLLYFLSNTTHELQPMKCVTFI